MLDGIGTLGTFAPAALLIWLGAACLVAVTRRRNPRLLILGLCYLVVACAQIVFSTGQFESRDWGVDIVQMLSVLLLLASIAFTFPAHTPEYRSALDLLFFRRPSDQHARAVRPSEQRGYWALLATALLIWTAARSLQPCRWLDRATGNSGCVREISEDHVITDIAFTPDSAGLAYGNSFSKADHQQAAVILNIADNNLVSAFSSAQERGHPTLAVSPDGRTLALEGNAPQTLQLWNLADGTLRRSIALSETLSTVHTIRFSPDGRWIGVPVVGAIAVFDAGDGSLARVIPTQSQQVRFTSAPSALLIQDAGRLAFVDPASGAVARSLAIDGFASDLALGGDYLAAVIYTGSENEIRIWNLATDDIFTLPTNGFDPDGLDLSTDGARLIVGSRGDIEQSARIRLWSLAERRQIDEWRLGRHANTDRLAFSPDGHLFAFHDTLSRVQIWRVPAN